METERTLLKDFSLLEMPKEEAAFVDRTLVPVLRFLPKVRHISALPGNVIEFLAQLRPIVGDRDFGIFSYSLGRALAGDVETCTARLLATAFVRFERMISNNATAFHQDERLTPEDVLADAATSWRIRVGPIILAMLDLAERGGHVRTAAEDVLFENLSHDQVESILGSLDCCQN
ncbi:MAG: hypothetical protein M3178_01175 [Pseudomonadota bacterium]|nr:hypothetical protein [Pseudomonadota bacterium]